MTILGNRVPYEYFITQGKGESDVGSKGFPYETGSYDAALFNAGIQNANVIEYTSVMPTESKEISKVKNLFSVTLPKKVLIRDYQQTSILVLLSPQRLTNQAQVILKVLRFLLFQIQVVMPRFVLIE